MFMYLRMLSWPVSQVDVHYIFKRDTPQPDITLVTRVAW